VEHIEHIEQVSIHVEHIECIEQVSIHVEHILACKGMHVWRAARSGQASEQCFYTCAHVHTL